MESRSRIFQVGLQGLIITGKLATYKPKKKIPGFLSPVNNLVSHIRKEGEVAQSCPAP